MRIAVVGQGIAGMVAAHLLSREHELTVYEARERLGGHTHTIDVTLDGVTTPVDTGFIVFNLKTYPNFVRLLRGLGVAWQPSDMSFGFRDQRSGVEYGSSSLGALFAQRRNLARPAFWRMLRDIARFNREAPRLLEGDDAAGAQLSLGDYLRRGRYSDEFVDWHIVPLGGAVWSSPATAMLDFPARYFVRFFANHGFLQIFGRVPWLVLRGGSRSYLAPLTAPYRDRVRLSTPVRAVRRVDGEVEVETAVGERARYERLVLAVHGDQALSLLADATPTEREVLSAFSTQPNRTYLHLDASQMPTQRAAWSSWNTLRPAQEGAHVSATYWMNRLQSIPGPRQFFVTLNPQRPIPAEHVLAEMTYRHPLYTAAAVRAQRRHGEIDGVHGVHFCGAYWGFGFHEDGVKSALAVTRKFGQGLTEVLPQPDVAELCVV